MKESKRGVTERAWVKERRKCERGKWAKWSEKVALCSWSALLAPLLNSFHPVQEHHLITQKTLSSFPRLSRPCSLLHLHHHHPLPPPSYFAFNFLFSISSPLHPSHFHLSLQAACPRSLPQPHPLLNNVGRKVLPARYFLSLALLLIIIFPQPLTHLTYTTTHVCTKSLIASTLYMTKQARSRSCVWSSTLTRKTGTTPARSRH